jgi:cephalosporin-C deacetylase-like acetyl esterase
MRARSLLCALGVVALPFAAHSENLRSELLDIPSLSDLPIAMDVIAEKESNGVKLTEFYFNGPVFGGQPTRIYAFYAQPAGQGPFPAVVQLHGSGLEVLKPDAALEYAAHGYACISIDWAGPDWRGEGKLRAKPYSEFPSEGNRARKNPETQKWQAIPLEKDARTNGIRFIRRALQFLRNRPEVDAGRLCISGMSAGAQATLGVLGLEPDIKAAAVKYGSGFIRELNWGGAYGPLKAAEKDDAGGVERWISILDPKHGLKNIRAATLVLTGTDDIFYFLPAVLATWRAIPATKSLLIFPNDNHSQVGNEVIPRQWFDHVLTGSPVWPQVGEISAQSSPESLLLKVPAGENSTGVVFWFKRMPLSEFQHGRAPKGEKTTPWESVSAQKDGAQWIASLPPLTPTEQIIAYATVEGAAGTKASSDTVELPAKPGWRLPK